MSTERLKMKFYKQTKWILVFGVLLAGLICLSIWKQQRNIWVENFTNHVERNMFILKGRLEINEGVLLGVRSFFQASTHVGSEEFKIYVSPIIKNYNFIQALEWVPRVPAAKRGIFEENRKKEGFPDFMFTERSSQGEMSRAGSRTEYFPVYYLEPMKGNKNAFGFDLASNPIRFKSLTESRDTGKTLATDKITLVQEKQSQAGVLIFAPFYGSNAIPNTVVERRDKLKGFVLGVYRIGDMIEEFIFPFLEKNISLAIFESDKLNKENKLFGNLIEGSPLQIVNHIYFFGRQWTLIWQGSSAFIGGARIGYAISWGAGVFAIFLFLSIIIQMNTSKLKLVTAARDNLDREITERKKIEFSLQKAKQEADSANRAKSVFLANMSHELRTPLNSILGFSQVFLHDKALSSKQKQGLGFINKSGNHLLVLIKDILDLSKIEAGRIEINPQLFRLESFIRSIESIMLEQAAAKDLSFIAPEELDLPDVIKADEFRLRQVLFNLIGNAIKFTASGEVRFAVSVTDKNDPENQTLRFEVTDTGTGIGKEDLEEIFYPFKQIGGLAKSEQGSGLGLTISRQLVALMGGELKVESEPGKGSRFWFDVTFPVHKKSPEETVSKGNVAGYKGKRLTALIADDKPDNLVLLQYMLSNIGFDVVTVTDGRQEIDMAIKIKPDIILTDLKMPVMDGNSAARAIRKVPELADTPIIAVSAGVMDINKEESIQSGCNDFLDKPIQLPALHKVLQKSLNLEWSYEELKEKKVIPPTELLLPPLDEIKRLMQAANSGNITTLKREISQIRDKDSKYHPLADKLEKWHSRYQLDKIVEFLKPYSEQ